MTVAVGEMRQYPGATAIALPVQDAALAGQATHAVDGPTYLREYVPGGHGAHWLPDKISPSLQSRNVSLRLVLRLYWLPSPDNCAVKVRVREPCG